VAGFTAPNRYEPKRKTRNGGVVARHKKIIERVSEIYKWIEAQQFANKGLAGSCAACGKCCDFEQYDHRLYVTAPEIIYFVEKSGDSNFRTNGKVDVIASVAKQSQTLEIKRLPRRPDSSGLLATTTGRCCYQINGKCSVHPFRFSGCRIFCCKGKSTFQSELTESAIKKFKALCAELQIPYRYVELPTALKDFTAEGAENAEKNVK
jgi:Fe-S-cluster containining protein